MQRRFRDARPALLQHAELARTQVFANLGADALADAVDLLDAPLVGHHFDGFVVVLDACGGVTIVGHPVAILAQQLHLSAS